MAPINKKPGGIVLPAISALVAGMVSSHLSTALATEDALRSDDWVNDVLISASPPVELVSAGLMAGWVTSNNAAVTHVADKGHIGNGSLRVQHTELNAGVGPTLRVKPHTRYTVGAWVFVPSGQTPFQTPPRVVVFGPDWKDMTQGNRVTETDRWLETKVEFDSGDLASVFFLVHSQATGALPSYYVDDVHAQETGAQVNLVQGGSLDETPPDKRQRLLDDFDLDLLDWGSGILLNAGGFFTDRGVRVCGGAWEVEYQEFPEKSALVERFKDNGIAVRFDGKPAYYPEYGGCWFMCQNSPKWHAYQEQGLFRTVPFVDSISQDNIAAALNKGGGCVCRWCQVNFRSYLARRFKPDQLAAMGAADLKGLDIRAYIQSRKLDRGEKLLDDALCREYIRCQFLSHLAQWRETCEKVRQVAAQRGRTVAIYGNQGNCFWDSAYSVLLSKLVDVVWLEMPVWTPPFHPQGMTSLAYKVALASGEGKKPVWCILYPESEPNCKRTKSSIDLTLAETAANNANLVLLWGYNDPDSENWQRHKRWAQFRSAHRDLFLHRERLADVGLIYSLPTLIFHNYGVLGLWGGQELVTAFSQALERSHINYDTVLFGHSDFWDDRDALGRLAGHKVLVCAGVTALSQAQREALKRFLRYNGRLIVVGELGTRTEDYARTKPFLEELNAEGFAERISNLPIAAVQNYAAAIAASSGDLVERERALTDPVRSALRAPLLEMNAPATVWANVWFQHHDRRISIHLVNYDIDVARDTYRPVENLLLRARLPAPRTLTGPGMGHVRVRRSEIIQALLVSPGSPDQVLPITWKDGVAEVVVPRLEKYAIVVFAEKGEMEAAESLAHARKWMHRIAGVRKTAEQRDVNALESAQRDYEGGNYGSAQAAVNALSERLLAKLARFTREREWLREQERTQHIALAKGATLAFDLGTAGAAAGWTAVTSAIAYDETRGWGWLKADGLATVDRGGPDSLHRDFVQGLSDTVLRVRLPDGTYDVTVLSGDPSSADHRTQPMDIAAQGEWQVLGWVCPIGVVETRTFRATTTAGALELGFQGANGWRVSGLVVRPQSRRPPESLHTVKAGAVRNWLLLGGFEDRDATGLDANLGPERERDPAHVFRSGDRTLRWLPWRATGGGFAVVPLGRVLSPGDNVVGFAQTRVHSSQARRAWLWLNCSERGVATVNGKQAVRDFRAWGLAPDENRAEVHLERGWNEILVKCCANFGGEWAFTAALTGLNGEALTGLRQGGLITMGATARFGDVLAAGTAQAFVPKRVNCRRISGRAKRGGWLDEPFWPRCQWAEQFPYIGEVWTPRVRVMLDSPTAKIEPLNGKKGGREPKAAKVEGGCTHFDRTLALGGCEHSRIAVRADGQVGDAVVRKGTEGHESRT